MNVTRIAVGAVLAAGLSALLVAPAQADDTLHPAAPDSTIKVVRFDGIKVHKSEDIGSHFFADDK